MATNLILNPQPSIPAANELRDIKPPVEIPGGWEWLWWVLALGIIAAILIAGVRLWRRRRTAAPCPRPVPSHIRAKQRLQDALRLLSQPKPFCTEVSDSIRIYLEERFSLHAPDRTTEEFLNELHKTELLAQDQKDSLGDFLRQCDLVKFAGHQPGEFELRKLHDAAFRLVLETEPPAAAPSAGNQPPVST